MPAPPSDTSVRRDDVGTADPDVVPSPPERWFTPAVVARWVESARVQYVVIAVIVINAATLGLETSPGVVAQVGGLLQALDRICLTIFVVELAIKLYAHRGRFFRSGWNVFDLLVVGIALVPGSAGFGVLRALRVLRVLRLVSMVPALRRVVDALVRAVPGILSIGALLTLLFYVSGVMSTMLFGQEFPDEFGSLPASLLSLFQVMTLDNWSVIARSVLEVYPWAPAFFVPFILLSAFTVLNLFIAVIVDAMTHLREAGVVGTSAATAAAGPHAVPAPERPEPTGTTPGMATPAAVTDGSDLHDDVRALRAEVAQLTQALRATRRD